MIAFIIIELSVFRRFQNYFYFFDTTSIRPFRVILVLVTVILLYAVCEVYIERVVGIVLGRGEVNLNWNSLSELKIAIDSLAPSEHGKKGQEKRKIFFHQGLTLYFLHDANGMNTVNMLVVACRNVFLVILSKWVELV